MKELRETHEAMRNELHEFLRTSEDTRKDKFTGMMNAIREQLSVIRSVTEEILDSSRVLLDSFGKDRQERADVRRNMSDSLAAPRLAAVKKAQELRERKEKEREIEGLKQELVDTISKAGQDGMKLIEMGAELGRSWQSLIPLVAELVDQGRMVKDTQGHYHKPEPASRRAHDGGG